MSAIQSRLSFSSGLQIRGGSNATGVDGEFSLPVLEVMTRMTPMDGPNFVFIETTGDTKTVAIGPASSGLHGSNGLTSVPDLGTVKAIGWECNAVSASAPAWTGSSTGSVTLGFTADCGTPGAAQTAAANAIKAWSPAGIILAGDFSYNVASGGGTALASDTAVWATEITAQTIFPVGGNHEWNTGTGFPALMLARFPYLTSYSSPGADHGPCYDKTFKGNVADTDPMVHVVLLDPCINSSGAFVPATGAPGLTDYGSWHAWIYSRVAAVPKARYRVAVVHFPPVTSVSQNGETDNGVKTLYAFLTRCGLFDAIICGHTHSTEAIEQSGTIILNCSSPTQTLRVSGQPLSGATAGAILLYSNSTARTVGRLMATPESLTWSIHEVGGGLLTSGSILPRAVPFGEFELCITGLNKAEDSSTGTTGTMRIPVRPGEGGCLRFHNGAPVHDNVASTITIRRRNFGATAPADNARNIKCRLVVAGR